MNLTIPGRFKRAWNVFVGRDPIKVSEYYGYGSSYRPDRNRFTITNEQTIVTSVCNRLALDVASLNIQHVKLDENGRYSSTMSSGLNNCLTLDANIDQTGRAFIQDAILSMLDEGCIALVPTYTDEDPDEGSYDILELRVGQITEWYPQHVRVKVYDDTTGRKKEVRIEKSSVAIIENPFYVVMNEPNSTLKRLTRKMKLLDILDEKTGNGKLDIIIQLPFMVKSEQKRNLAETRRKELENQLMNSKYGIAYTDASEHITQLNRPAESNLMSQIEYLTNMLYSHLNITASVLDGTADEATMLNYYSRTIEPLATALVDEMKRKFLTKTARTQRQSVEFFRDPFNLVPVNNIAEIADKFTRNEIMTSNEIRQVIGMKPSADPNADMLRNKNLNQSTAGGVPATYDVNGNLISPGESGNTGEVSEENPDQLVSNAAFGELVQSIESKIDTLIEKYKAGEIDVDANTLADAVRTMASQIGANSLAPEQAQVFDEYLDGIEEDIDAIFGETEEMSQSAEGEVLSHYASPYYDPVKAHEYYMRTRQLKGRRSSSALSDEGKKVWSYTKEAINTEKKEKIAEKKTERDTAIEQSRTTAAESRTRISDNLKALNEALTARAASQRAQVNEEKERAVNAANNARDAKLEQIKNRREQDLERQKAENQRKKESLQKKRDDDIKNIQNNKNMSSAEKKAAIAELRADSKTELAKLTADNKTATAKIRTDSAGESASARSAAKSTSDAARATAKSENARITSETKAERAQNTANAKTEREKVAANLKTEIANARNAFNEAKTQITQQAETNLDTEYSKILAEYPKPTKKKKSSK